MAKTYYYNYGISSVSVSSSAYTTSYGSVAGNVIPYYTYINMLGSSVIFNNTGIRGTLSFEVAAHMIPEDDAEFRSGWKCDGYSMYPGESMQIYTIGYRYSQSSTYPAETTKDTLSSLVQLVIKFTFTAENGTSATTGYVYVSNNGNLSWDAYNSTLARTVTHYKYFSNITFTGSTTAQSSLTVTTPASTLGTFTGYTKNISTLAAIAGATFKLTPYAYLDLRTSSYKSLPSEILNDVCADYELTGTTNSNGYVTFAYGVFGGNLRYKVTAAKSLTTFYGDTSKILTYGIYTPTTNGTSTMYGVTKSATDTTNIYLIFCEYGESNGKKNGGYPVPFVDMIPQEYSANTSFTVSARYSGSTYNAVGTKSTGATFNISKSMTIDRYSATVTSGSYNTGSGLASASVLKVSIPEIMTPTDGMFSVTNFVDKKEKPVNPGYQINRYYQNTGASVVFVSSATTSGVITNNYAYCINYKRAMPWNDKIATFQDLADMYSCYNVIKDNSTDFATYVTNNRSNLVTTFKNKLSSTSKVQSMSGNSVQQCYYDGSNIINLNTIYPESSNPKIKPADYTNYQSVLWDDALLDVNAASTTYPIIAYYSCTPSYTSAQIVFTIEEGSAGSTEEVFITNSNSAIYDYYSLSDLGITGGRYYINQQITPGTTYSGTYLTASNSAGSSSSTTFTFKAKSYPDLDGFSQLSATTTAVHVGVALFSHEDMITIDMVYVYVSTDNGATWTAKTTSEAGNYWDISSNSSDGKDFWISGLTAGTTYLLSMNMYLYDGYSNGTYYKMQLGSITTAAESAYEFVDLGLSIQWCSVNIGASSAYDAGKFFAWGDTEGFDTSSISGKFTSSWYSSRPGHSVAADITPSGGHDAARVNAGSPWRMPTRYEFNELMTGTTKSTGTTNGIKYVKYTSKYDTSKYIIIPCDGAATGGSSLVNVGAYGYSWTSNFTSTGTPGTAVAFIVTSGGTGSIVTAASRNQGFPIRPVDEGPELDSFNVEDNGDGGSFVINEIELEATNSNIKTIQYQYLYGMGSGEWLTQSGYILNNSAGQSYFYNDDDWIDYPGTIYCYVRLKIVTVDGKTHYTLPTYVEMSCCFIAGTQVLLDLSGNTKNIEDIQSGDTVVSYNKDNGEYYITEVVKLIAMNNATNFAKVTLENGYTVTMNEYHPILTTDGWHSITNHNGFTTLQEGDVVITKDGTSPIVSIERWTEEPTTMYNLDVHDIGENPDEDNNDNFIANGMVVHNGC